MNALNAKKKVLRRRVEWPTLGALLATYVAWGLGTTWLAEVSLALAIPVTALAAALFSSLQHEALHGHPFRVRWLNEAAVFPALAPAVPYGRFRDSHLAHHRDATLTDPYDDPETNYLDPAVWARLPAWLRAVLRFNNRLAGRLLVGPVIGEWTLLRADWAAIREGDRAVARAWALHVPAVAVVVLWLATVGRMPVWAFLLACYGGLSILKIRSFLEHQAHEHTAGRTAIVEARGPLGRLLALLFLNNNLHVVHHMHPAVAWYALPGIYGRDGERYRSRNGHYVYRSYGEVLRRYFLAPKDPVPHPLMPHPPMPQPLVPQRRSVVPSAPRLAGFLVGDPHGPEPQG